MWALFFACFNFITIRPGERNAKADALSRSFIFSPIEESKHIPIMLIGLIVAALSPDLSSSLSKAQVNSPPNVSSAKFFVPLSLRKAVLAEILKCLVTQVVVRPVTFCLNRCHGQV